MRSVGLAIIVILAAAGAAAAQEEIELLDGSKLQGSVEKVEGGKIVVTTRPEGSRLDIPLIYLSPYQQYRVRVWQYKPEERDWTNHANLADWCLKHYWLEGAELDPRLKQAADAEFKQAREKGGPEETLKEIASRHGFLFKDGALKTPAEAGLVWDDPSQRWVTAEEKKKLEEERKAELTKDLKKQRLIGNWEDYLRAFLPYVSSMRKYYEKKKIRFWARLESKSAPFGPPVKAEGATLSEDKYVRLLLREEDTAFAYVEKGNKRLLEKIDTIQRGERVQVCGQVFNTETGFAVVVADLVAD